MEVQMTKPNFRLDGREFEAELMQIRQTHIGFEDHNMFSWGLSFAFNTESQGTGFYRLTDVTTIAQLMNTVGARTWEQVNGKLVYVLREEGRIVGIANVVTPTERFTLFEHLVVKEEEHTDEVA